MKALSAGHVTQYGPQGRIPCDRCSQHGKTAFYLYAGFAKLRLCVPCAEELSK